MRFSNKQAKATLKRLHKREHPLLLDHGILVLSKEIDVRLKEIDAFFEEDDKARKSDRRFYRHQDDKSLDEMLDTATSESEEVNLSSPDESDSTLDVLDQIEDERLLAAFASLNPMDREIIVLHKIDGHTLRQIAARWNKPYSMIEQRYYRAIQKIKKFF